MSDFENDSNVWVLLKIVEVLQFSSFYAKCLFTSLISSDILLDLLTADTTDWW